MKAITASTCTEGWYSASDYLLEQPDWRCYSLVLEITNPMALSSQEREISRHLDKFLTAHHKAPISTVINTIFPAPIFRRRHSSALFEYFDTVRDKVRKHPDNKWGTYFDRMTRRVDATGKTFNPLRDLIQKLSRQLTRSGPARAAYEVDLVDVFADLPIYDGRLDRHRPISGPCLSHLSFKLTADCKLMLTAFYRSHYYIARALGNLYGLALLQSAMACHLGIQTGELVCHSSMATLEVGNWGKSAVHGLLGKCETVSASAS